MERYGSRTVAQKLGIKEGSTVAVIDAPRDYAAALGELPAGVEIVEDPEVDSSRDALVRARSSGVSGRTAPHAGDRGSNQTVDRLA